MKSFKRFIREEEDKSESIKIDPTHQALVIKIARSIIDERRKGNEPNSNEFIDSLRTLEKSGVSASKIADALADARRELNKNPLYGGPHHRLAREYQKLNEPPPGENLDKEA